MKTAADPETTKQVAKEGLTGTPQKLPHLDKVQGAFEGHDLSNVKAYVGGPAAKASKEMGASAYATGDKVAFKEQPDVKTVAHEATHVVQQREGVSLKGGVGEKGDQYEKAADAVAESVGAGKAVQAQLAGSASLESGGVQALGEEQLGHSSNQGQATVIDPNGARESSTPDRGTGNSGRPSGLQFKEEDRRTNDMQIPREELHNEFLKQVNWTEVDLWNLHDSAISLQYCVDKPEIGTKEAPGVIHCALNAATMVVGCLEQAVWVVQRGMELQESQPGDDLDWVGQAFNIVEMMRTTVRVDLSKVWGAVRFVTFRGQCIAQTTDIPTDLEGLVEGIKGRSSGEFRVTMKALVTLMDTLEYYFEDVRTRGGEVGPILMNILKAANGRDRIYLMAVGSAEFLDNLGAVPAFFEMAADNQRYSEAKQNIEFENDPYLDDLVGHIIGLLQTDDLRTVGAAIQAHLDSLGAEHEAKVRYIIGMRGYDDELKIALDYASRGRTCAGEMSLTKLIETIDETANDLAPGVGVKTGTMAELAVDVKVPLPMTGNLASALVG